MTARSSPPPAHTYDQTTRYEYGWTASNVLRTCTLGSTIRHVLTAPDITGTRLTRINEEYKLPPHAVFFLAATLIFFAYTALPYCDTGGSLQVAFSPDTEHGRAESTTSHAATASKILLRIDIVILLLQATGNDDLIG